MATAKVTKSRERVQCRQCGRLFWRPVGNTGQLRLYCGKACRNAHGYRPGEVSWSCRRCGKEFDGRKRRYCSKRCRERTRKQHSLVCSWCRKAFASSDPRRVCCSQSCGQRDRARREGRTGNWRTCQRCRKVFRKKSGENKGIFCTRGCAFADRQSRSEGRLCCVCGARFYAGTSFALERLGIHSRDHCSAECYRKDHQKKCAECGT